MMKSLKIRHLALLLGLPAIMLVTACSDDEVDLPDPPIIITPPPPVDPVVVQVLPPAETLPAVDFGAVFSTAFNADTNDEPLNPVPGDLPPVTKQADPTE